MGPTAGADLDLMARAIDAAGGMPVEDEELRRIWAALESHLPRTGHPCPPDAALADMVCHLLRDRLGARLPEGPQYEREVEPLAADLHAMPGITPTADRSADRFRFVGRRAQVYTDVRVPLRYRLLAQRWARMACGRAFTESGKVLVPPTLDGAPPSPHWFPRANEAPVPDGGGE